MAKDTAVRYQSARGFATAYWEGPQKGMFPTYAFAINRECLGETMPLGAAVRREEEDQEVGGITATQVASSRGSGLLQSDLRPPILPLRFPLSMKSSMSFMPDTTSLPPSRSLG